MAKRKRELKYESINQVVSIICALVPPVEMLKKPYEIFSYVKKAHDLPSVAEFLRQCLDAVHKFLMFAYAVESLSIDTVEARVKEALARRSRDSDSVREIIRDWSGLLDIWEQRLDASLPAR